jgi:diacylglycerol kinase (ATP)
VSHRKRVIVAANRNADPGSRVAGGARTIAALREAGHDVIELDAAEHESIPLAFGAALALEPDAIVAVGGDGTVNAAANAITGTDVPIGIVPAGSGNDLARALGLPVGDLDASLAQLLVSLQMTPRTIDLGRAGDGPGALFASVLSAGFDAIVNERADRLRFPTGPARYGVSVFIELAMLQPRAYRLWLDDELHETDAVLVAVANGGYLGGGMRIAPGASLDDGLFDVVVVRPLSRLAFVRAFPRVYRGEHLSDPRVSVLRARRVRIEAADIVAYADGEPIAPLPLDVEIVPQALRVLA